MFTMLCYIGQCCSLATCACVFKYKLGVIAGEGGGGMESDDVDAREYLNPQIKCNIQIDENWIQPSYKFYFVSLISWILSVIIRYEVTLLRKNEGGGVFSVSLWKITEHSLSKEDIRKCESHLGYSVILFLQYFLSIYDHGTYWIIEMVPAYTWI